jgi:hypothetical protein
VTDTALIPYDSEAVAIREVGMQLAAQAEAFVIVDDDTDLVAKTVLAAITKGIKAADARRVELKAPALAECKAVDAAFADAVAPYKTAKDIIARKTGAYFAEKKAREEAARRAAERAEREAAEKRRREEEIAAAFDVVLEPAPAAEPPVAIEKVETITRTESGTVGMAEHRTWEVVDEAAIPREYFVLDEARVGKEIRAGGEIPGIKVVITYVPRTR